MGESSRLNVLFCCLGNICRSPMAEAVFAHKVRQHGLEEHFGVIDSCGTADYHEGEEPDMRYVDLFDTVSTVRVCKMHKVPIQHLARAITPEDFYKFDYIFGMECVQCSTLTLLAPTILRTFSESSPKTLRPRTYDTTYR